MKKIPSPEIIWRADGSPESKQFSDIYFSVEDGLAETRHVFHAANKLPEAWRGVSQFTIAETGFGTGLNFLATLALWQETRQPGQSLNYVSVEGFPLSRADLGRALAGWPELAPVAAQLLARYPAPHRGTHQIAFPHQVTLTLIEDDVLAALKHLDAEIDTWFLDGFSPSTNPDMWSPALFKQIARLSHTGTHFATFTAAGAVRRGLAAEGFDVQKVPGFGRKREMLAGHFIGPKKETADAPWYQRPKSHRPSDIAVIGAGVAGVSAAAALSRLGLRATLYEEAGVGAGASGNPAALFMPRMAVDESAEGRFHLAAYLHMERWLTSLDETSRSALFRPCGVLQIATNRAEGKRFEKIAARELLPPGHLQLIRAEDIMSFAGFDTGLPALFFPKSGVLTPSALLDFLKDDVDLHLASVAELICEDQKWSLMDKGGRQIGQADTVILANGPGLGGFAQTDWLPQEPVRGQISFLPKGQVQSQCPAIVAGHYLICHPDGSGLTGATYELGDIASEPLAPTATGHAQNLEALATALPSLAAALQKLAASTLAGRVALRAQVPDRVPFAGPAPDAAAYRQAYDRLRHGDRFAAYPPAPYLPGLYLFGGLGARGFATSLLLAEHIAAQIAGAPLPLPQDLGEAVHPARFIIRSLRKNLK